MKKGSYSSPSGKGRLTHFRQTVLLITTRRAGRKFQSGSQKQSFYQTYRPAGKTKVQGLPRKGEPLAFNWDLKGLLARRKGEAETEQPSQGLKPSGIIVISA